MAASLAHLVGRLFRRPWPDCRELIAAGAGAGLATAFNAPIAGAVFVLEELVQRFEHRIAIAALGASATAITVARVLLGDAPDFSVAVLLHGDAATRPRSTSSSEPSRASWLSPTIARYLQQWQPQIG
jgi:CIC family chloride channel protein